MLANMRRSKFDWNPIIGNVCIIWPNLNRALFNYRVYILRSTFDLGMKRWPQNQKLSSKSKFDLRIKVCPQKQKLTLESKVDLRCRGAESKFDLRFWLLGKIWTMGSTFDYGVNFWFWGQTVHFEVKLLFWGQILILK